MLRPVLLAMVLLASTTASVIHAAPAPPALSRTGQEVRWTGTLDRPGLPSCGEPAAQGCDTTSLTVVAPAGMWITVAVDTPGSYLRVADRGRTVGNNGRSTGPRSFGVSSPSTTFQQVRAGRVVYEVGVSDVGANPADPVRYGASARLAGKAFDRTGDCFVGDSGAGALLAPDDGSVLPLSVRLVAPAADLAEVRRSAAPALIETFARIGVRVRVTTDATREGFSTYPYERAQRMYGVRPPGVDVVFVFDDGFGGGIAACLGGVAYPEKAFASGQLHYALEATVPVPTVKGALIAAHEIGHLLGAQHQMSNCVEALPQQVLQPASDGSAGPCTVMGPAAVQGSETFSTLEKITIRSYVRQFARG